MAGSFLWLGGAALAQQTTLIQDTPVQQNQSGATPISSSTKQFLTKTAQDSAYELASHHPCMRSSPVLPAPLRLY
jgi:hypothetical protein